MKPRRLDHIVLAVHDLTAALDAWSRTFGLQAERHTPDDAHMELGLLRFAGNDPAGAFLELVAVTGEPALSGAERVARHLDQHGEGMFSISLEVPDLDAAVAELTAAGLPVSGPDRGALPNTRVARIPRGSAHGTAIQLIQRS